MTGQSSRLSRRKLFGVGAAAGADLLLSGDDALAGQFPLLPTRFSPRRSVNFQSLVPAAAVSVMGRSYSAQSPNMSYNLSHDPNSALYRFEVHAFEHWSLDSTSERSELAGIDTWPFETDVWLAYSMMVEPGDPISSAWCVVGQMHNSPDNGEFSPSPPLAVEFDMATQGLMVTTRGSAVQPLTNNPPPTVRWIDPNYRRGGWDDFVIRTKLSYLGTGQIQMWRNGAEIINASGLVNAMNDAVGPYWKFGVYRGPSVNGESFAVQYANMEVGLSSLAARIDKPLNRAKL